MIFVTADSCRSQLESLTKLLVSAFPGSTIYQHTDLFHVPRDVLSHKVDAVLLSTGSEQLSSLDLMQKLHKQKPTLPIFIISPNDALYKESVAAGAMGYFVLPGSEELLLETLRSTINKESVS